MSMRGQLAALQVIRDFFHPNSPLPGEGGSTEMDARPTPPTMDREPTQQQMVLERSTPAEQVATPEAKLECNQRYDQRSHESTKDHQEEELQLQEQNNVEVVSPSVVGLATPIPLDLMTPLQLAIRREHLFPEGAIHPKRPHKRLNREGTWRWLKPYDLPGVRNLTANTPANQRQLAKNEENLETLQIVEYLQDVSGAGRRGFRCYPPRYEDPFFRRGTG